MPPALAANLWQPGQTGNPGGIGSEYKRCLSLCRDNAFAAADEIIRLSTESDDDRVRMTASAWVYERAWGKPKDYDPKAEADADRPRFNPRDYTPDELKVIEAGLRLMLRQPVLIEPEPDK